FGFIRLDDAWATGSSMLPQKKNPDVAELARGKAGRLIGHLVGFLTTLKGLPLAYNRDLQEDKEPFFDAADQVSLALVALDGLLATARYDTEAMQAAADGSAMAAVELAEWLVGGGTPFRDAYDMVGSLVRESVERGVPLAELIESHPAFGTTALNLLEPMAALRRHRSPGSTGPDAVAVQLEAFAKHLEKDAERVARWRP
ncbi:argininosuccinate lyase, partial [mine drainage metagenome]